MSRVPAMSMQYTWGCVAEGFEPNGSNLEYFKACGSEIVGPGGNREPLRCFKLLLQTQAASRTSPATLQQSDTPPGCKKEANQREMGSIDTSNSFSGLNMAGLFERLPATTIAQRTARPLRELDLSPVTVITDFLSAIRGHTLCYFRRVFGETFLREIKIASEIHSFSAMRGKASFRRNSHSGMKGSRWELRHLTGSPGGGGVKGPVIL
ncbi:hypothetical protein BDD12DRAFT_802449 [Trichophaea hybrida]|nr:hypothetical protein BDD12DRAFT_802449 [Trichophaea hybrida]